MARKTDESQQPAQTEVRIAVPVIPAAEVDQTVYVQRHIDMRLTPEHAELVARVRQGLLRVNAKLQSGRPVFSCTEVFRWLLEAIESSIQ